MCGLCVREGDLFSFLSLSYILYFALVHSIQYIIFDLLHVTLCLVTRFCFVVLLVMLPDFEIILQYLQIFISDLFLLLAIVLFSFSESHVVVT